MPSDTGITVERFRDELGDWRVCILSPFGARLHAPWALAVQRTVEIRNGFAMQLTYTDDGIAMRFADVDDPPGLDLLFPGAEEVEALVTEQLAQSALFSSLFRENSSRALLITRRRPQSRSPLWAQRRKAESLLAAVRKYPKFPIVLETYRQALGDVFDLPALKTLMAQVQSREVTVHEVETPCASPFARSLVFAHIAAFIYEQDAPVAERKAQALTLDRGLLSELLGEAELRELIDPDSLQELEMELQCLSVQRCARDADELHDLLRRLGDLTSAEVAARTRGNAAAWLESLREQKRVLEVDVAHSRRWIAAQDFGLYRDALGCTTQSDLPASYVAKVEQPVETLVARFARNRGPFEMRQLARRYRLTSAELEPVLEHLLHEGRLVHGEIRPDGSRPEWCDREVLKWLKQRTLAKLRGEIAVVDGSVLGSFLPHWQGVGKRRSGERALEEVLEQLQGLALPWSVLIESALPIRVQGFKPDMLDLLAASGRFVWVGCGALGAKDGRIRIYSREAAGTLCEPTQEHFEYHAVHSTIVEHLEANGACFALDLHRAAQRVDETISQTELQSYLWDLVWAGRVTNDTFQPLSTLAASSRTRPSSRGVASGRWSSLSWLYKGSPEPVKRAVAQADVWMNRYGIVSREVALSEAASGGFSDVYRVLCGMEETGKVRRGYFLEGLSGSQFAHHGAVERLRADRNERSESEPKESDILWLQVLDPANPYGALLPWPTGDEQETPRPRRLPGAWVSLLHGKAVMYVSANRRQILTFSLQFREYAPAFQAAAQALHRLPRGRRRSLIIEKIDGEPANQSAYASMLEQSGFAREYRGLSSIRTPL